jgi:hypothetical protein
LLTSEAAKNYEEARSRMLDNRLKATATWFDIRRLNVLNRYSGEGPTDEQLFRINQARLPARLTPAQLDPVTGRIEWPVMLAQDQFAAERGLVEEAFATRAVEGGFATSDQYLQLRQALEQMKGLLNQQIEEAPSADYLAARSFLDSLDYEAQVAVK